MLTRLKVSGFKNLLDIDVRFGPFTCIAGPNGVGKSNLFDAIQFLSLLADRPLTQAAFAVRGDESRPTDLRSLFYHSGDQHHSEIKFYAEMIIPAEGIDDLGQKAQASITFLKYELILRLRKNNLDNSPGPLELIKEDLRHINLGNARENIRFPHSPKWRKSAVTGRRTAPFISTETQADGQAVIKLHQEGNSGRPISRLAMTLPRTVLSAANAAESPTVLLAKSEMISWRMLQLEPSALRKPDEFTAPTKMEMNGLHLAAALNHLAKTQFKEEAQAYGQITSRLAELIDDIHSIWIDRDSKRELLTLFVKEHDGTAHPARSLSDGTLRFLALAIIALDPKAQGLICLEEPENGIHPVRIEAMLRLLQDIATDTEEPIGEDNPLRQVIINTHSPAVVQQVPDACLLMAAQQPILFNNNYLKGLQFQYLSDTWRSKTVDDPNHVSKGKLLAYLQPSRRDNADVSINHPTKAKRVLDREDLRQLVLPGFD